MNETTDLKRIRMLLDSYYDGTLSPSGRDELSMLLTSTSCLPDYMETEKRIYLSIENQNMIQVPEYLSQRIESSIGKPLKQSRKFRWHTLLYTSAAASVILILTIIWNATDIAVTPTEVPEKGVIAADYISTDSDDTIAGPHVDADPDTGSDAKAETTGRLQEKKLLATVPRASVTDKKKNTGNVRIITDQEEADMILNQITGIISENFFAAEMACDKPEIIIESMNHTLSKTEI